MGVGGQNHAPATLPLGKRPGSRFIGGWVGSRVGLEGHGNSPTLGFVPPNVKSVASRYTDGAYSSPLVFGCDLEASTIRRAKPISAVEPINIKI
jgi:hypothetical protein